MKASRTVLVGTYRPANEAWIRERRLYNLPLPKCGKLAFHERIDGIVLFAEGHPNFAFYSKPYPVTGGRSMPYVFDCLKPYFRKWKSATTFNPVQEEFLKILFPIRGSMSA